MVPSISWEKYAFIQSTMDHPTEPETSRAFITVCRFPLWWAYSHGRWRILNQTDVKKGRSQCVIFGSFVCLCFLRMYLEKLNKISMYFL